MMQTGLLSRIADFSNPLASAGSIQEITFKPGTFAIQLSKVWECCWANWPAAPEGPRKTIGQLNWPADWERVLAALLTIWSKARMAKFQVMNSTTGRKPFMAAPTPMPAKPSSAIGVSITLLGPNSSNKPLLTLYAPSYWATSSPIRKTVSSRRISSINASLSASRSASSLLICSFCQF